MAPESTKKSYTFPLKDTFFVSARTRTKLNLWDMLPRQNWDGKLLFSLLALNL